MTLLSEYDTLYTLCDLELCFWLSKFFHEIKKKDGSEYPPNTLYQICAGLQRGLKRECFARVGHFPKFEIYSKISLIRE